MQVYEIHRGNIARIFQHHDNGLDAWKDMKDLKASKLIEIKKPDLENRLLSYVQKLHRITKLSPQGGVVRPAETTEHYIARALQKLAKLGKLNQVKVE